MLIFEGNRLLVKEFRMLSQRVRESWTICVQKVGQCFSNRSVFISLQVRMAYQTESPQKEKVQVCDCLVFEL